MGMAIDFFGDWTGNGRHLRIYDQRIDRKKYAHTQGYSDYSALRHIPVRNALDRLSHRIGILG